MDLYPSLKPLPTPKRPKLKVKYPTGQVPIEVYEGWRGQKVWKKAK